MFKYKHLIVESGNVSKITINRPDRRNSLNTELLEELADALWYLDKEDSVRVIIIKGNGKGFCAGAELDSLIPCEDILASKKSKGGLIKVLTAINKIGKITIAQVHGFALAGGFGLATATDLSLVAEDTILGLPEIKRGIFAYNVMNPISRLMPRKFLLEMLFTGDNITTAQAFEWGLFNKVVKADELEAETIALAEKIAVYSPSTIRLGKESFYNMQQMDYYAAFEYLTNMLTINSCTNDSKEGIAAFFDKRSPNWTER